MAARIVENRRSDGRRTTTTTKEEKDENKEAEDCLAITLIYSTFPRPFRSAIELLDNKPTNYSKPSLLYPAFLAPIEGRSTIYTIQHSTYVCVEYMYIGGLRGLLHASVTTNL